MKKLLGILVLLVIFTSAVSFADTGSKYGGGYGANWTSDSDSSISSVVDNIADSETYDVSDPDVLTDEEVGDIEALIFLIIEKNTGTLHLTAKDILKARNMQRTYMLATMMPKTGGSYEPIMVTNVFPQQLPATGGFERNIMYLFLALFGVLGLTTTLSWKQQ